MSVSSSIKKTLKKRIEGLDNVQKVYGYKAVDIDGWPAVMVVAANMDGEFTSTTENRRRYAFLIAVLQDIGQQIPNLEYDEMDKNEQAEEIIGTVVDDIINDFDNNFQLSGNADALFMGAANAEWGFINHSGGIAKACTIGVTIVSDYNVND